MSAVEVMEVAHDWAKIKIGRRSFEITLENDCYFGDAAKHDAEVKQVSRMSVEELKRKYKLW